MRSGKSKLLEEYMDWVHENDLDANIVSIDLTKLKFEELKEYHKLNDYVEEHFEKRKNNYLFVDEIQMCDTLSHNLDKINHKTVGAYQEYLCNAYAFYKVRRYDIRGKKYLASSEKYYLCDHSFRYAKLGTKNFDYGRVMENIVAIKRDEKIYI